MPVHTHSLRQRIQQLNQPIFDPLDHPSYKSKWMMIIILLYLISSPLLIYYKLYDISSYNNLVNICYFAIDQILTKTVSVSTYIKIFRIINHIVIICDLVVLGTM